MDIFKICLWIITVCLLIGAFIPLLREQIWWLRAWTYARLQKFCIAIVLGLLYFGMFGLETWADGLVAAALLIVIVVTLRDILPFTALGQKQVEKITARDPSREIKLFVGNVLMDNDDHARLTKQIDALDPDIIFLVETNSDWRGYLREIEARYPHHWLLPLEDYNGMLLYSKFPLHNITELRRVQDHIPSVRLDFTLPDGRDVTFHGVHPRPPRPEDDTKKLDKELLIIADEIQDADGPLIVTGDLNDVGWSSTTKRFLDVSGLRDPRRGRGLYNTFNAKNPLVRWPLDHVFISDTFELVEMRRLDGFGSDHFPIYIHLSLRAD